MSQNTPFAVLLCVLYNHHVSHLKACRLRLVVPGALQERGLSLAHQFDVKGQETFPLPHLFSSTLDNPFTPPRRNVLLSAERTPTYDVLLVVPVEDRRQRC